MKRASLVIAALALSACGEPELTQPDTQAGVSDAPSETSPSISSETSSEQEPLTTPNCSPLQAARAIANGDDGNVPGNVLDDRLDTRWSRLGRGSALDLDLGSIRSISGASIAWHLGDQRTNAFTLSVSSDGVSFSQVHSGQSGKTAAAQTLSFPAQNARYLRITVNGNTQNDWASIAEARACGSSTAPDPGPGTGASVVWRGDFETGSRSQWSGTEMVNADRLQVVTSPTRQGRYALRATVRQGDDPINASGNRNELLRMTHEPAGSEYYYKWSTMFPSDFPSVNTWQLFTQWHHEGPNGSPPVEFYVRGERIYLRLQGRDDMVVWNTPLVRGQWLDFIFHAKWSPDSRVGFVELYYNGQLVLPKKNVATMYAGDRNYLKIGLYRDASIGPVGVVYHDGWTMARELQDVLSPTATGAPETAAVTE